MPAAASPRNRAFADARRTLLAEPPERFTATRDALVKELRAAGDKDAATALKAERRPTRLLWALRTASASHELEAARFRKAAEAAAAAQARGAKVRERTADLRDALSLLAAAIAARTDVERTDVSGALLAIAADPDALDALDDGTLAAVPEPTGFGLVAAGTAAVDDEPEEVVDPKVAREARARVTAARKRVAAAGRAVERAEGARDRARDALDQAEAKLADAQAEEADAARELTAAEADAD